jgi:hypothetical protein
MLLSGSLAKSLGAWAEAGEMAAIRTAAMMLAIQTAGCLLVIRDLPLSGVLMAFPERLA